jgi:hypothetical protein
MYIIRNNKEDNFMYVPDYKKYGLSINKKMILKQRISINQVKNSDDLKSCL